MKKKQLAWFPCILAVAFGSALAPTACKKRAFNINKNGTRGKVKSMEGQMTEQYETTGGGVFKYLDSYGELPSNTDRNFSCPSTYDTPQITVGSNTVTFKAADEGIEADWTALKPIVSKVDGGLHSNITVINIIRVNGKPYYHYLSDGSQDRAMQPWSSTKPLATAAAIQRFRTDYSLGITGTAGPDLIGDLITIQHNYNDTHGYTSNGISGWMQDFSGRDHSTSLIQNWLNRPAEEIMGGAYGPDGGWGNVDPQISYNGVTKTVDQGEGSAAANNLSTFTMAEFLKRMVMHREDASTRLPGAQWEDFKILFYGAENSKWFGKMGGMSAGQSIYLYDALGKKAELEKNSEGKWRIFHKLGYGEDVAGEFRLNAYLCLPYFESGKATKRTKEFVVSVGVDSSGDNEAADQVMEDIIKGVTNKLLDGSLK